jgi:DivIVA domain-containing protein
MEGILEPEEVRSRKFEMVRRGYDKRQVDRFRDEAAVTVAALTTELNDLRDKLGQAGMADVPDLKSELDAVSGQVAEILESAREAAEGMRSRASEDASRWRADADKEARALRGASAKDAEQARRSAWEEASALVEQTDAQTKKALEDAAQDALFIRAEAEREALRLTGDARRDKEESARQARTEADRVLIEARAESERILEKARQSAQSAQERAQALEQRRAELMQELEAARLSIGQMEQEIDSRREALQAAAEAPASGVRVIKTTGDAPSEWIDDDASVRIVPASRVTPDVPVDPDAFVAEVEQLQAEIAAVAEAIEEQTATGGSDEAEEPGEHDPEPAATGSDKADPIVAEAEPVDAEPEETGEPEAVDTASSPEPIGEPGTPPQAIQEPAAPAKPAVPDGIEDLFAQLRTSDTEARAVVEAAPEPRPVAPIEEPASETASAVAAVAVATAREVSGNPFELRDRVLLPIENRTLRSVKRRIVDLQNRVLEELRVGDAEWEPDRSMFVAAVSEDVATFNQESFVAGHAAAAELLGEAAAPPPDRAAAQTTSSDFVDTLVGAVGDALKQARASGGGSRQLSAAVGRVFRAWRTDEAERRLRHAGYLAYNEGLIGAYPELGVDRVVAVAPGTPCGDCPAGSDASWDPGGPLPSGTVFPPAGPDCRATILPAN